MGHFDEGAFYLVSKSVLDRHGRDTLGWPDNSQFVMPAREMDQLLTKAGGDVAAVEKALGIPPGQWADQALGRIDLPKPRDLNLRMPSGNEMGANEHWLPGGRLPTGYREAVINQIPKAAYVERGVMGRGTGTTATEGVAGIRAAIVFVNQIPESGARPFTPWRARGPRSSDFLYVVEPDGKLVMSPIPRNGEYGHHDLTGGGNPVIAAGEGHFYGGKVKLDNVSGHYRPEGQSAQGAATAAF